MAPCGGPQAYQKAAEVRRASRNGVHSGPFWAPGHTLGAAGPRVGRRGGARTRSSRQNGIESTSTIWMQPCIPSPAMLPSRPRTPGPTAAASSTAAPERRGPPPAPAGGGPHVVTKVAYQKRTLTPLVRLDPFEQGPPGSRNQVWKNQVSPGAMTRPFAAARPTTPL